MKTIEVISIPVTNQEESKQFYMKLGFEVIVEAPMGNGRTWIQLGMPNQVTTITLVSWWPYKEVVMPAGSLQGIILETDDIEKEVQELKTKGIKVGTMGTKGFEAGKIDNTLWGKFAYLNDPDGNGLSIHQFITNKS